MYSGMWYYVDSKTPCCRQLRIHSANRNDKQNQQEVASLNEYVIGLNEICGMATND